MIGPDPTLKMGQLGVPREMANNLTIPVRVTSFNIDMLQEMTDKGQIKTIVKPDDKTVIDLKRFRRGTRLMMGDIIYRAGEIIEVKDNKQQVLCGDIVERNGKEIEKRKGTCTRARSAPTYLRCLHPLRF